MTHRRAARILPALAAGAALTLTACSSSSSGSGSGSGSSAGASGQEVSADRRLANVTITAAHGCTSDKTAFPAGGVTFKVKNKDATAVSEVELLSGERIVGEKENLPPGFSGEFAVNVTAGSYTLYCPGGTPERRPIKVTGVAASPGAGDTVAALLRTATVGYADYVDTQVASLLTASERFDTALHGSDLATAQKAYIAAQAFAQLEPAVDQIDPVLAKTIDTGFAALDQLIDGFRTTSNPSGFKLYNEISAADKRSLAAAVKAVQEPLSKVAGKVANA